MMEGLVKTSDFIDEIVSIYKINKAVDLAQLVSGYSPTDFGKLAPVVVKHALQKDAHALAIMQAGAQYLSQLAKKLLDGRGVKLSLIGGCHPL
ncbi:hypothetical protein [Psychrosphaera algicola]|uniref:Uncharacterized protein n=1 Tax=Psychrosphaera algicola TaxID=3023714 RepID=A0ABT5FFZ4_9GAMM|nr:hypothetical protein [Psychrosphaera sp. G1-22]MDC2889535.1 hypothetical protein [Psychrosphaera sp. G1-22]